MPDFKQHLITRRRQALLSPEGALSTGSTLLNLACTSTPDMGFLKGAYYYLVGDSDSGKTWLSMTCFAEATLNKHFKHYRLIFDDVEGGAMMDIGHYFGKEVARRIQSPLYDSKGKPINSETVEDFYYNIHDVLDDPEPCIYVLDSQDALDSTAAQKKFKKQKSASEEGEDAKGSFGDGKAKYHSEHIRGVLARVRKRGDILIIIGQTRDNVGSFSFEKKTRAGGKSLKFYANMEIWTSRGGSIKRRVRGEPRTVGLKALAEVKKNRITGKTGKDRQVCIPIYNDMGIDDVGSCVDYLIEEGQWKKVKVKGEKETKVDREDRNPNFDATELLFTGTRGAIIDHVENEGLEAKLRTLTGSVWNEIEEECKTERKRRYE